MQTLLRLAAWIVVNGLALWVASVLVSGVSFGRGADTAATLTTVVLVAVVFGLVNAIVKPVVKTLSLPLIWLTLGLFTLVVNAAMLSLTSWVCRQLGLAFRVDEFFWDAVLGGLVVTLVSMVLGALVPDRRR